MSRIILLEKSPWAQATGIVPDLIEKNEQNVRRPFNGISIKKDTFANLAVRQISGGKANPISLIDSSAPLGYSNSNHNFILQDVQHASEEKAQIVETFGDHFTWFYGKRPTVVACSGVLFNSRDFNWKNEWVRNYDLYLRGTKCVENKARVFLSFDDVILSGYILSTNIVYGSSTPYFCPFGFNLLLTDYEDLSQTEDYVRRMEEAFETEDNKLIEYIDQGRSIEFHPFWEVDPLTGESRQRAVGQLGVAENHAVPADGSGIANWGVAPSASEKRQAWDEPDKALRKITTKTTAQETGKDETQVGQALRRAIRIPPRPEDVDDTYNGLTQAQVDNLKNVFNPGVSNTSSVIDDAEYSE